MAGPQELKNKIALFLYWSSQVDCDWREGICSEDWREWLKSMGLEQWLPYVDETFRNNLCKNKPFSEAMKKVVLGRCTEGTCWDRSRADLLGVLKEEINKLITGK